MPEWYRPEQVHINDNKSLRSSIWGITAARMSKFRVWDIWCEGSRNSLVDRSRNYSMKNRKISAAYLLLLYYNILSKKWVSPARPKCSQRIENVDVDVAVSSNLVTAKMTRQTTLRITKNLTSLREFNNVSRHSLLLWYLGGSSQVQGWELE